MQFQLYPARGRLPQQSQHRIFPLPQAAVIVGVIKPPIQRLVEVEHFRQRRHPEIFPRPELPPYHRAQRTVRTDGGRLDHRFAGIHSPVKVRQQADMGQRSKHGAACQRVGAELTVPPGPAVLPDAFLHHIVGHLFVKRLQNLAAAGRVANAYRCIEGHIPGEFVHKVQQRIVFSIPQMVPVPLPARLAGLGAAHRVDVPDERRLRRYQEPAG